MTAGTFYDICGYHTGLECGLFYGGMGVIMLAAVILVGLMQWPGK